MSNQKSPRRRRVVTFTAEALEVRRLLSGAVRMLIPALYDGPASQLLLGPTVTQFQMTAGFSAAAAYYRFATDAVTDRSATSIVINPAATPSSLDAAVALYDERGNLVQIADADATASRPGQERLDAVLAPKTVYTLGIFSLASIVPLDVAVVLPEQAANASITLDPASTQALFSATSGENRFNTRADPDYYPLNFFNGKDDGVVTVSPIGLDVESAAAVLCEVPQTSFLTSLIAGDTAWQRVVGDAGPTVTLNVAPVAGQNLADGRYLLSVAPRDFATPASSYRIDISATQLASPSAASETPIDLGAPLPSVQGTAQISRPDVINPLKVYSFTAATTGMAEFEVAGPTFGTTLALYDGSGTTLLAAGGRTTNTGYKLTYPVTAGTSYRVALAPASGAVAVATLLIRQAYAPMAQTLGASPLLIHNLLLGGSAGSRVYRLSLPPGVDAFSVRLTREDGAAAATTLRIVGPNVTGGVTRTSTGTSLNAVLDSRPWGREIDLAIAADAPGLFSLSIAAVTIAKTIGANLPTAKLDMSTGDLSASAALGAFGSTAGVKFWALDTPNTTQLSVAGSPDAMPILAQYEQRDGVLRLVDFSIPTSSGVATRTATLATQRLAAIVAVSARPDGAATSAQIVVNGDRPLGVGIAPAPEPIPSFTGPPPIYPPGTVFTGNVRIRNAVLRDLAQRDLWQTIVPRIVTGSPVVTFGPATPGGDLALRLLVMNANNDVLAAVTTTPGQKIQNLTLSALTPASIAGQTLRYLVEPVGSLGEGAYTLEVSTRTSDPQPYQVTEPSFTLNYVRNQPSLPVFETIQPVNVNSFVDSSFTSSTIYNSTTSGVPGAIDVFRFVHGPTPFTVWTESLSGGVNTSLAIYKGEYSGGNLERLTQFESTPFSFDYYAADRSQVDARVEMWNTDLMVHGFNGASVEPGRNTWYVVVKNEEGSTGQYRFRVADLVPQRVGPGNAGPFYGYGFRDLNTDPRTGSGTVTSTVSNGQTIRATMPGSVQGNLSVSLTPVLSGNRQIRLELLDSSGGVITSQTLNTVNNVASFSFSGLSGLGRYFLRPTIMSGGASEMTMTSFVPLGSASSPLKPGAHNLLTQLNSMMAPAEPYTRANQFADGTFLSSRPLLTESGLLHKVVFWVDQPGFAQFILTSTAAVTSKVFALWRGFATTGELNPHIDGRLRDFKSTPQPDGSILLEAAIQPGMYFLTVDGNVNVGLPATVTIRGSIPLPTATLIELDPNTGSTSAEYQHRVDPMLDVPYPDEQELGQFRTTFYKVITPGGSQAGFITGSATYPQTYPQSPLNQGRAYMSITRLSPTVLTVTTGDTTIDLDGSTDDRGANVTSTTPALAGDEYYIAINRDRFAINEPSLHVTAQYTVPQSGTPDIVVERIRFEPFNGRTLVNVDLRNLGFATVGLFRSRLTFSNYSYPNGETGSLETVLGMGILAPATVTYVWDPTNRAGFDSVTYVADILSQIQERSEGNNSATASLQKVRPTISSVALADPLMDGDPDPNVWGRYVRGVAGQKTNIIITPADGDGASDIYRTYFREAGRSGQNIYTGPGPHTRSDYAFEDLQPTSPTNLNRFEMYVQDQWGLTSDVKYVSANVVAKSSFFTGFTFDPATHLFNLAYDKDIVRYDKSISQIIGTGIPLIGDKRQKFILHLGAKGTATLNPKSAVSIPLGADIELTAFDSELYKKSWTGSTKVNDHLMIGTTLEVTPQYLDVSAAAASFQLRDLELLNIRTPKIPLFSFGIPKVAAITANFSLGLKAGISAGVKVGLNPAILADPLGAPLRVGLMSPTFVQPRIEGSAYISGDVEVLGFDIGSLEGRISLGLNVTVGLDNNDPSKVIPLDELADRIRFNVTGDLSFGLSASVIIIGEVWSWEPDPITFPLGGNTVEGIITNDPGLPGPYIIGQLARGVFPTEVFLRQLDSGPTVKSGSDPVGAYQLAHTPQLVIDPQTGFGLTVQVGDGDPSPEQTRGQLQFAVREDSASPWTALAPIGGDADYANPVLVATHDADAPYMLVYEVVDLPGNTQDQTFNQRLVARDLRYRTWNGAGWSEESVLTSAVGGDSDVSLSFAPDGTGVAAWVHNSASIAMDEEGNYARDAQDIVNATWDPLSNTWSAPQAFVLPDAADSQPAVFAEDGKLYATWLHALPNSNGIWFATNDGSGWTTPDTLEIAGLDAGGRFTSVALGSEGPGRVTTIFNYRVPQADGSTDSKLYARSTTSSDFTGVGEVEVIADRTNFSHVRTTNAPDGSLIVSWKAGNGVTNEIYAARRTVGATAWGDPIQLTHGSTIEERPAVAVEPDGRIQVLYEIVEPGTGDAPQLDGAPLLDGVGGTTGVQLPEIGFIGDLEFDDQTAAVAGSTSTGRATVVNRGGATTDVVVEILRDNVVVGSRTLRLAPGAEFDASFDFSIAAGLSVYSIRLSTADPELVGGDDNLVSRQLNGLADIEVVSLQPANPNLPPSSSNPLQARIRNRSNLTLGGFAVDFRSGDELFPHDPWSSIGTVSVGMLPANGEVVVSLPVSVPFVPGTYVFSVYADVTGNLEETTLGNNRLGYRLRRQADPGLQLQGFPQSLVSATLLNASGIDNVRINATLFNFATGAQGAITAGPVSVRLLRSVDGGEWVELDSQAFTSVSPGGFGVPVVFITSGLAGDNRYRVVVDPQSLADDANPFNNVAESQLSVRGLPNLSPLAVLLDHDSVDAGDAASITVDIVNSGIAAAEGVTVEVIGRLPGGSGSVVFGTLVIARLDPLSAGMFVVPLDTNVPAGAYELVVVVNRGGIVLEATDQDNTSSPLQLTIADSAPRQLSAEYRFDDVTPGYQIVFNEPVTGLDRGELSLLSLTTGETIDTSLLALVWSAGGAVLTIRYLGTTNGVLPDGDYVLSLAPGVLQDLGGHANTATLGGAFFVLAGDANRDRAVGFDDLLVLAQSYGSSGRKFSQGDFDYDGVVSFSDLLILAQHYGTSLLQTVDARVREPARPRAWDSVAEALIEASDLDVRPVTCVPAGTTPSSRKGRTAATLPV